MQAITQRAYGPPLRVLRLEDTEVPEPGEGQVRLAVRAASANARDWHFATGLPRFMRLMVGLRRPKQWRFGRDVAGVVEAVGPGVSEFAIGDEVFGAAHGSFAERAVASVGELARKPADVSFEDAACLPIAGCTAYQALVDHADLQSGQRVLITGASGGVGSLAVQIAKARGLHVTAVCGTDNVGMVRALGADIVVDHRQEDVLDRAATYHAILDLAGRPGLRRSLKRLEPGGALLLLSGDGGDLLGPLDRILAVALLPKRGARIVQFTAEERTDTLEALASLVSSGDLCPHIARTYQLPQAAEAIDVVWRGHPGGKHVITL